MLHTYKTEGVVLGRFNIGEADRIVRLFTKQYGKISCIAKGIRRIPSRRAPHLEVFNQIMITAASGRTLDSIVEVSSIETFPALHAELERVAHAYKVVEQLDRLCPERQEYRHLYMFLINTLQVLDSAPIPEIEALMERFTLELLWETGYLEKKTVLTGRALSQFFMEISERSLRSDVLLTRVTGKV